MTRDMDKAWVSVHDEEGVETGIGRPCRLQRDDVPPTDRRLIRSKIATRHYSSDSTNRIARGLSQSALEGIACRSLSVALAHRVPEPERETGRRHHTGAGWPVVSPPSRTSRARARRW